MRRRPSTTLLRLLLATLVALSGLGPRSSYAHSHSTPDKSHHAHDTHDAESHHEDDDHEGELPSLGESFSHVHGSWFGVPFTLPATDGGMVSPGGIASDDCPTLTAAGKTGPGGPMKEHIPWLGSLPPPELCPLLAGRPPRNAPLDGAGTSHALAGRTLVLRC